MSHEERTRPKITQKWGFGMAPPKLKTQECRERACAYLLEVISTQTLPPSDENLLQMVSEVKGMFTRIVLNSPWQKSSRHSTVPASRRTALRFGHILPVCTRIAPCPAGAGTVSVLAGLSPRTGRDQWDWFTVSGRLGYPPRRMANLISQQLKHLRMAIKTQSTATYAKAQTNLCRLPTQRCLSWTGED